MSRVLVAEDDPEMRRLVVEALAKDGHVVLQASDGAQMLVRLAELFHHDPSMSAIDAIVADIQMPLGSGLALIERLAEARWKIPCILMTAFADEDVRRRAQGIGALLLEKPLALDELREAVARLARG